MPAFTQHFIDGLEGDGTWHRDSGGKNSISGLLLYAGRQGKTYYVEVARGSKVKIGNAATYTLKKARNIARQKLGRAADGHDFKAERQRKRLLKDTTLRSYLDGPFKEHAQANIASHKGMLPRIARVFHQVLDKPMSEITEMDMAKWRRERNGVSLETQRRELANLKALLNHAVDIKAIPSHQLGRFKVKGTLKEGEGEARVRFLSGAEEKRLRDALEVRDGRIRQERSNANKWRAERGYEVMPEIGPHEYADHIKPIVLLALNTGLRRGDLFGLKWDHIDLSRRQIRKIIEKTSHARRKAGKKVVHVVLPLSAEAHMTLSQLKKQRNPDSEYVFPSPRSGGRLDNIKKAFEGVVAAAKIENFRFHDLRHTFASRLVMAGVDINTVRELMTHSDIKMTLVYAHLSPDYKAAALDKAFSNTR